MRGPVYLPILQPGTWNPEFLQKEMDYLRKALSNCKYPRWAMDRVERRSSHCTSEGSNNVNTQDTTGADPTTNEPKT